VAAGAPLPAGFAPTVLAGQPVAATPAPLLALAGALLLVGAGVAVLVREPRLPRLGARYAAAGSRPPAVQDPDRAAWVDLDEGRDPTVDTGGSAPTGRGDDS
jgi:hypothetical protein